MKVVKPKFITPDIVVSSNIPTDTTSEWVSGATYNAASSFTNNPDDYKNAVKKPNFADGLVGNWGYYGGPGDRVTATAAGSKYLRFNSRDTLEAGNPINVTEGELLYLSAFVYSADSDNGGAFGVRFLNVHGTTIAWLGAPYAARKSWHKIESSIVVPPGAVHATPWLQIDHYFLSSQPFVGADLLRVARGPEGSASPNLVIKSTFDDGLLGTWASGADGSAASVQESVVPKPNYTGGYLTANARDTYEWGSEFVVYPGETLYMGASVLTLSSVQSASAGVAFISAEGSWVGWSGASVAPGVADWQNVSYTVTVPGSAVKAIPWLQIDGPHEVIIGPVSFANIYVNRIPRGQSGPFVKRSINRTLYQRLTTGSTSIPPESDSENWTAIGPVNDWALFDREVSTRSVAQDSLSVTITPGYVNSLSLFGMKGNEVTVTVRDGASGPIVYGPKVIGLDSTLITDWYQYYYEPTVSLIAASLTDLPPYKNAHITVELTGSGEVSLGLLDVGTFYDLGGTDYGASFSVVDYSRKEVDEFGGTKFVKRGFAKRLSARSMFRNVELNKISSVLAELRATPCSWSVTDESGLESLNIFGWYEDMDIEVPYPLHSYCSITIQGLVE